NTPAQIEASIGNLAHSDIGALFHPDMTLKRLDEVAPEDLAAINSIETNEFHYEDGNVTRRIYRIRLERKQPALDSLDKLKGLSSKEGAASNLGHHFQKNPQWR